MRIKSCVEGPEHLFILLARYCGVCQLVVTPFTVSKRSRLFVKSLKHSGCLHSRKQLIIGPRKSIILLAIQQNRLLVMMSLLVHHVADAAEHR